MDLSEGCFACLKTHFLVKNAFPENQKSCPKARWELATWVWFRIPQNIPNVRARWVAKTAARFYYSKFETKLPWLRYMSFKFFGARPTKARHQNWKRKPIFPLHFLPRNPYVSSYVSDSRRTALWQVITAVTAVTDQMRPKTDRINEVTMYYWQSHSNALTLQHNTLRLLIVFEGLQWWLSWNVMLSFFRWCSWCFSSCQHGCITFVSTLCVSASLLHCLKLLQEAQPGFLDCCHVTKSLGRTACILVPLFAMSPLMNIWTPCSFQHHWVWSRLKEFLLLCSDCKSIASEFKCRRSYLIFHLDSNKQHFFSKSYYEN